MRYWVANHETVHLGVDLQSANIFKNMWVVNCPDFSRIKQQIIDEFGKIPKRVKLLNCVGGGSSAPMVFGVNLWIISKNLSTLVL